MLGKVVPKKDFSVNLHGDLQRKFTIFENSVNKLNKQKEYSQRLFQILIEKTPLRFAVVLLEQPYCFIGFIAVKAHLRIAQRQGFELRVAWHLVR